MPTVLASTQDVVTEPIYLVELGFDPIWRITNAQDLNWDGHDWVSAPLHVSSIDNDAVGGQTVSIEINNHDRVPGALVLSQVAQDRPARVWLAYKDIATSTPLLIADGMMDGASVGEKVQINIISRSTAYGTTPRILCAPPLMNHLPKPGTVLKTGNVSIVLRSR